jgi:hypothetical protein
MAGVETYLIWTLISVCLITLAAVGRLDWLRLTGPRRRVMARVIGHRPHVEGSTNRFAALFSFTDESGVHEVVDSLYIKSKRPAVGTLRELVYPEGRPDLARAPRWWALAATYTVLLVIPAMLFGKWMGWMH